LTWALIFSTRLDAKRMPARGGLCCQAHGEQGEAIGVRVGKYVPLIRDERQRRSKESNDDLGEHEAHKEL
jgi:hypothetical protein